MKNLRRQRHSARKNLGKLSRKVRAERKALKAKEREDAQEG